MRRLTALTASLAMLSACGGGGGSSGGGGTAVAPTPTPSPATSTCSLRSRQDWAAAQLNEWYLFPDTLPASLSPAAYSTVQDYIDALTATARSQSKDRYFTYITSIAEENAYYSSGASKGFGLRLAFNGNDLMVTEAFEGAPALAAGIDRGAMIMAIGTTEANLREVGHILLLEGSEGLNAALNSSAMGETRVFRIRDAAGIRNVTARMAEFELLPVSPRYGAKVLDYAGKKFGYINLRTFISSAASPLRNAFADFKAQGITNIVIDLRYNGGGLVSIANLVNDLLAGDRTAADVSNYVSFRPSKASNNETVHFAPQPQSIAPTRIAFIGTSGSASASELVMNTFIPYMGNRAALIGSNTYGKPVGQIAIDRSACDDRLRVVAFATENSARQAGYFNGLAPFMGATCSTFENLGRQLGDPSEMMTLTALRFLNGEFCAPIRAGTGATADGTGAGPMSSTATLGTGPMELLRPERPTTPQREVPGLF